MSPGCLEGSAQLRGVAHSHNGPHFHPNATVHSINLSAGIRHSPSFLVLIFSKRSIHTRRVLRLSEPGDGLDKPVLKGVRSDGRQVHSCNFKHFNEMLDDLACVRIQAKTWQLSLYVKTDKADWDATNILAQNQG
jgi:hypothetical protein